jgi:hypothetical protein
VARSESIWGVLGLELEPDLGPGRVQKAQKSSDDSVSGFLNG